MHLHWDYENTEEIYPTLETYEAINGGAPFSRTPARATEDGPYVNKQVDEEVLKTVILAVPS